MKKLLINFLFIVFCNQILQLQANNTITPSFNSIESKKEANIKKDIVKGTISLSGGLFFSVLALSWHIKKTDILKTGFIRAAILLLKIPFIKETPLLKEYVETFLMQNICLVASIACTQYGLKKLYSTINFKKSTPIRDLRNKKS